MKPGQETQFFWLKTLWGGFTVLSFACKLYIRLKLYSLPALVINRSMKSMQTLDALGFCFRCDTIARELSLGDGEDKAGP